MRFLWVCLWCVLGLLDAETQKTQIIQTYIYPANKSDFSQKIEKGQVQIKIQSKDLLDFMASNDLKDRLQRQVVRMNASYTEFKSSDQIIHTYSNSLNPRLRFNLAYNIYELEYLGNGSYRIKNIDGLIDEKKQCDFVIQKTLTNAVGAKRDFVINLDNYYYFSKVLATHQFLQCARR